MNPGFETTIDRAIVIVSQADGRGFEDDQSSLARPDGFWRGARYDVRSGADAGRRGMVTDSQSAGPGAAPRLHGTREMGEAAGREMVEDRR
jgi:hypothetical protein